MIATLTFWECLAGTLVIYWLLPLAWRLWFLGGVSVAYLAIETPANVGMLPALHAAILGGLAGLCYVLGPRTSARRASAGGAASPEPWSAAVRGTVFWGLIGLILAYLLGTKYVLPRWHARSLDTYVLPLGTSYIAFKLIHCLVEFARGTIKNRSVDSYLTSVFVFPTLAAGPIERYDHFLAHRRTTLQADDLLHGAMRIVVGLVKRFFIAEQFFGPAWQFVNGGTLAATLSHVSPLAVWRLAFFCVFYMYLDFSAYSDIAIGCCRLFGLTIMENFDWPLIAPNLPAFWRRWHMTLTGWCQAYIFLPVLGKFRSPKLATFVTFLVIGLWHGSAAATWPWALWGSYHGLGMISHQSWAKLKRKRKWDWPNRWWWYGIGVAVTVTFVSIGDLLALFGPTSPRQVGTLFLRLAFIGGHRHG